MGDSAGVTLRMEDDRENFDAHAWPRQHSQATETKSMIMVFLGGETPENVCEFEIATKQDS